MSKDHKLRRAIRREVGHEMRRQAIRIKRDLMQYIEASRRLDEGTRPEWHAGRVPPEDE